MTDIYGTWYEYCALEEQPNTRICTPVLEPVVNKAEMRTLAPIAFGS
jgi:hypothetical protein